MNLAIPVLGGIAALGLVFSGKKKTIVEEYESRKKAEEESGYLKPPPGLSQQEVEQWLEWIDGQVIKYAGKSDPAMIEAVANQIEAQARDWTGVLKTRANQAVIALRSAADALRVDRTRPKTPPPPMTQDPIYDPPPPPAPPNEPPVPPPIQQPPATDWESYLMSRLSEAITSASITTAEHIATQIEQRIPEMPPAYQTRARQTVEAIRAQARQWRQNQDRQNQQPIPPPVYTRPPEPPPQVDPVLERRRMLAEQMTNNLKQGGGPPANRGREDQDLVALYQSQEGLTTDGKYGVGTGLTVVKYGIVPAKPYWFSKSTASADKARWKARMREMAAEDPARASEWLDAAKVDHL